MPRYSHLSPAEIEAAVAGDLDGALGKRGATVTHDGRPGRPDIIVDAERFAFIVEVAKRSGADAASEYLAIRDHRAETERELGKPTHLLFSCLATPDRIVRAMAEENSGRVRDGDPARSLFLELEALGFVLDRLISTSADLYPLERWVEWFQAAQDIGEDVVALEKFREIVLEEDEEAEREVERRVERGTQLKQEALRRDIQHLEDVLRHRNVLRDAAMRVLVYLMFVKLYEEKRQDRGDRNRFTRSGFIGYRDSLPERERRDFEGRTFEYLLSNIAVDREVAAGRILEDRTVPRQINDEFLIEHVLPVLDRYRFRGTHLDALGAVFEALARRAEKDTRIGQFFTPEPIVRMAVSVARPQPTEIALDPAAGTGRFLTTSMERMLDAAGEVSGVRADEVRDTIRSERLLGTDADTWIVTIAKMNMYIHGDGKSNIRQENGLFLADLDGVFPGYENLHGAIDLVLTNPPLGDLNYRAYAEDLVSRRDGVDDAPAWLHERLPILPGRYSEEAAIEQAEAKIAEWEGRLEEALRSDDETEEAKARRWRRYHEEKRATAQAALDEDRGTYEVSGNTAKGGALFLAAIKDYLKPIRDAARVEEWRGGRVGIIVDEAILNTPDYAETRRFLRRHFYIKAVFSFDRDAFWYQARTTAKTSLLYLYRKPDPDVRQQEPIFYCHIEKIGFTRTGRPDESEIGTTLEAYRRFEEAMHGSYRGHSFDEAHARTELERLDWPPTLRFRWSPGDDRASGRLDYAYHAAREIRDALPDDHGRLGDYVESVERHPPEEPTRFYSFATVDRNTGEVGFREITDTKYSAGELLVIEEGDIVVSGIDLVNGSVGCAGPDVDGLVVSKEFYTLRVRSERRAEVDPRYLAILLRTPRARELIAGTVTGTSNRTRVQDEEALLSLPLPPLPHRAEQERRANQVHEALEQRRRAADEIGSALKLTDRVWGEQDAPERAHDDALSLFPPGPRFMPTEAVAEREPKEREESE